MVRIPMTDGYYIKVTGPTGTAVNQTPVASSSHQYAIVPCSEGAWFRVSAQGTSVGLACAFVDADSKLIKRAGEGVLFAGVWVRAPEGAAKLIINNYKPAGAGPSYQGTPDTVRPVDVERTSDGYYIHKDTGYTETGSAMTATGFVPVSPDTEYEISFAYLSGNAAICEYDANTKYLRTLAGGSTGAGLSVKTGQDAAYLRVTGLKGMPPQIVRVISAGQDRSALDALELDGAERHSYSGNPLSISGVGTSALVTGVSEADENTEITVCGKNLFDNPAAKTETKNGVTITYDPVEKTIRLVSETGATQTFVTGSEGPWNGSTAIYDWKMHCKLGKYLTLTSNCSVPLDYNPGVSLQMFSGTDAIYRDLGHSMTKWVASGRDVAVRAVVSAGWVGDVTFRPQVEFGTYPTPYEPYDGQTLAPARRWDLKARPDITNIYTNDDAVLNVTVDSMGHNQRGDGAAEVTDALKTLAPRILHPYSKLFAAGPVVCFVDDDTTSLSLVRRYHDLFDGLDAVGNYAVMPFRLDADANLVTELLGYEAEGFGMMYHINYQMGDETNYFMPGETRDIAQVMDNFVTGLRKMSGYGFVNYRYWVTPYGVNDEEIQAVAKRFGMRCLLSTGNNAVINRSNADRWNIPRYGFATASDNTAHLREALETCKLTNGMMVVTTHVNTWGADTAIDERFRAFVEHCISEGVRILSFPEAFELRYPMFLLNELF